MSDDSCYHCSRSSELFSTFLPRCLSLRLPHVNCASGSKTLLGKLLIINRASLNFRARNTWWIDNARRSSLSPFIRSIQSMISSSRLMSLFSVDYHTLQPDSSTLLLVLPCGSLILPHIQQYPVMVASQFQIIPSAISSKSGTLIGQVLMPISVLFLWRNHIMSRHTCALVCCRYILHTAVRNMVDAESWNERLISYWDVWVQCLQTPYARWPLGMYGSWQQSEQQGSWCLGYI